MKNSYCLLKRMRKSEMATFSREENPALFDLAVITLRKLYNIEHKGEVLSERELSYIKLLDTRLVKNGRGLTSLNGVEKMPNMSEIVVMGTYREPLRKDV